MQAIWNRQIEARAAASGGRLHPYEAGEVGVGFQDFVADPHLIREVLEDYRPWSKYPAIETFYQMLEWVNGPESGLESIDCAFAYRPNAAPPNAAGRLMIMYRKTDHNLVNGLSYALTQSLVNELTQVAQGFIPASFDLYQFSCGFTGALKNLPEAIDEDIAERLRDGFVTCIEFKVTGAGFSEILSNLEATFKSLWYAMRRINEWISRLEPLDLNVTYPDRQADGG